MTGPASLALAAQRRPHINEVGLTFSPLTQFDTHIFSLPFPLTTMMYRAVLFLSFFVWAVFAKPQGGESIETRLKHIEANKFVKSLAASRQMVRKKVVLHGEYVLKALRLVGSVFSEATSAVNSIATEVGSGAVSVFETVTCEPPISLLASACSSNRGIFQPSAATQRQS